MEPHDPLGLREGEEVLRQLLLSSRDSLSPLRTGPPVLLGAEKQLFKTKSSVCVCAREKARQGEILTHWGPPLCEMHTAAPHILCVDDWEQVSQ